MTTTAPPPAGPGPGIGSAGPGPRDVEAALRRAGVRDVDASSRRRAEYSTDASLYRVVPQVVVFPRSADEVAAAVEVARETGVPVVARGGGTSIAGNAVSTGVVLDTSRHLDRLLELDVEARTAVVEPGVVLGDLQRRLAPHGLRFGPDPSSGSRAALGGMIGNNACGSRALGYGRTDANVLGLHAVAGTGERLVLRSAGADRAQGTPQASTPETSPLLAQLRDVVAGDLATLRTELGRFGRQVSGYALEHLLPEKGFDVSRLLVGSEGTLALLTRAELRLVRSPERTALVVLGFRDMVEAAEAVPAILRSGPVACEGLDRRLVEAVEQRLRSPVPALPEGGGWLLVELGTDERGATPEGLADLAERARAVVRDAGTSASRLVEDAGEARTLWRIREDGAGLATRAPSGRPGHAGWEDTAVPPERLAAYLREFDALMDSYGLTAIPYGHFGDGCLHVRIDYPLEQPGREGVYREFVEAAAALVASHGGSMSGEHGDGRARSELLHHMYSPRVLDLFAQVKDVFDPLDVLNPGVLVRPRALDEDLRPRPWPTPDRTGQGRSGAGRPGGGRTKGLPVPVGRPDGTDVPGGPGLGGSADGGRPAGRGPGPTPLAFGYRQDDGSFAAAVHRCVGVGKCRADMTGSGGVMCPSYLATKDEKDSTRGRSRVLQEMVAGSLGAPTTVSRGWRSPEVHEALDLCLSCKGCLSDCPTGVDMATYKAEATHQAYKGRLRPASHYVLGWLPYLARLASRAPALANGSFAVPPLARLLKRLGGIDQRRALPRFAGRRFSASAPAVLAEQREERSTPGAGEGRSGAGGQRVVLWADSFTEHFSPEVGHAAIRVLEHAGFDVGLAPRDVCCGLTLISTGQLDLARRQLRRTVRRLAEVTAGEPDQGPVPLVVLEPSCLAVLRHDASALLSGDDAVPEEVVTALAARSRTLAEVLAAYAGDVAWPHLDGLTAVAQPHCHQHAVLGFETDVQLLEGNGVSVQALGGCCGLAGNFGVEKGHYDVSVAVARTALLPAVEAAPADAVVLADGFSCRTQLAELADRGGIHLAQLLARGLEG